MINAIDYGLNVLVRHPRPHEEIALARIEFAGHIGKPFETDHRHDSRPSGAMVLPPHFYG